MFFEVGLIRFIVCGGIVFYKSLFIIGFLVFCLKING